MITLKGDVLIVINISIRYGSEWVTLNAYHLNYGHIESESDNQFPEHKRDPRNLEFPVWICVRNNPDTVPASQHKQVFSDSLYLVPLFPQEMTCCWTPSLTMEFHLGG